MPNKVDQRRGGLISLGDEHLLTDFKWTFDESTGYYRRNEKKFLGYFKNPSEASVIYQIAKQIREVVYG